MNVTTTKLSPAYPVKEVDRVLVRLLQFMAAVPAEEIINFAKIDLSDGFWRMLVADNCKWNFAYTLPGEVDAPVQVVIPHALQMGWTESPGYFRAATETGRDIMQAVIDAGTVCPPHALDAFMTPHNPARRQTSPETTVRKWQMSAVYDDDYILADVEDRAGTLLQHTSRAALYTIHGLFPPPARSGHLGGKDPISAKKLAVMPDGPTPKNYSASSSMGRTALCTLLSEKRPVLPTTPPSFFRKIEWHFTNFSPSLAKCVTSPRYCPRRAASLPRSTVSCAVTQRSSP